MQKLFETMPYRKEFEGRVVTCREGKKSGYEIVLDQTIFFPEGGGQPFDTGTLGEASVTAVHIRDGRIVHETDKPLSEGSVVTGVLDWERRFDHMQQHSGEHLLTGLIHKKFGYDNVGFHMGSEEITIDFNGLITPEELEELELAANQVIYEQIPIQAFCPDAQTLDAMEYRSKKKLEGEIRIVEIPGVDVCACCGTHVSDTSQIGMIKVLGMIHYKGGVRISFLCGKRAFLHTAKEHKQAAAISNLLSAKPALLVEAVEKVKQENEERGYLIHQLYQELFTLKTAAYPDSDDALVLFQDHLNPTMLRQFATMLYEQGKGSVCVVCSGKDGLYQYAAGSKKADMKVLGKVWNGALNGKGGGSSLMIQGTFQAEKEAIIREVRRWEETN